MTEPQETTQTVAEFDYYLPAMPRLSGETGRFERFVKNLFRRRGGLRVVVQSTR